MILPRVITSNGTVLLENPIPELQQLRRQQWSWPSVFVNNSKFELVGVTGLQLEIQFDLIGWRDVSNSGIKLRSTLDANTEYFALQFTPSSQSFGISAKSPTSTVGTSAKFLTNVRDTFHGLPAVMHVQLFIDNSVTEMFINQGLYRMANRGYSLSLDSVHNFLYSTGPVTFQNVNVWEIASTW